MEIKDIRDGIIAPWRDNIPKPKASELQGMIQDLEYQRWWLHQEWLKTVSQEYLEQLTTVGWWKQIGAFVCALSRQQGKTQLLYEIAQELIEHEQLCIITAPYASQLDLLKDKFSWHFKSNPRQKYYKFITKATEIRGLRVTRGHLFVDEYSYKEDLDELLNFPWRSVSLFGSLK
jgi:hypothetical protein